VDPEFHAVAKLSKGKLMSDKRLTSEYSVRGPCLWLATTVVACDAQCASARCHASNVGRLR